MWFTRKTTTLKVIEASEKLSAAIIELHNGRNTAALVLIGQANTLLAEAKGEL